MTTRRSFLQVAGGTLGVAWLALDWRDVSAAAHHARESAQSPATATTSFLAPAETAIVDAIASQIIPTDATPGAREAGVVFFIDRALATFFAHMAVEFRAGLTEFTRGCQARYPDVETFASLSAELQVEWLKVVEHSPFFDRMRQLTVIAMFSDPKYGGNRNGLGWQLIGFQDQHVFSPPYGYYDRDYPGFEIPEKRS
jgi:gluconate 2-dehydrogenase gamma chain